MVRAICSKRLNDGTLRLGAFQGGSSRPLLPASLALSPAMLPGLEYAVLCRMGCGALASPQPSPWCMPAAIGEEGAEAV